MTDRDTDLPGDHERERFHVRFRENWYRDIWLLAVSVLVVIATLGNGSRISEIQKGRRAAVGISCAVSSAVVRAGQKTITAAQPLPLRLQAFLAKYGYPSPAVRAAQAKLIAAAYAASINEEVVRAVGVRSATLVVRRDGTLDCTKVETLSKTGKIE